MHSGQAEHKEEEKEDETGEFHICSSKNNLGVNRKWTCQRQVIGLPMIINHLASKSHWTHCLRKDE